MQFIENFKKNKINSCIAQYGKSFNPLVLVDLVSSFEIFGNMRIVHLRQFFNLEYTRKIKFVKEDRLIETFLSKNKSDQYHNTLVQLNLISVLEQRKKWLQIIIKQVQKKNRFQLSLEFFLIKINKIISQLGAKYNHLITKTTGTSTTVPQVSICNNFLEPENQKTDKGQKITALNQPHGKIKKKPPVPRFYFHVDFKTPQSDEQNITKTLLVQQDFLEENQQVDLINNSSRQFKEEPNSANNFPAKKQILIPTDVMLKSKHKVLQLEKKIEKSQFNKNQLNKTTILETTYHTIKKKSKAKNSRHNIQSQVNLSFYNRNKNKEKTMTYFRKKVSFKNDQTIQENQHINRQYIKTSQCESKKTIILVQPPNQKVKPINRLKESKIAHHSSEYNKKIIKEKEKITKRPFYSRYITPYTSNKVNSLAQEIKNKQEQNLKQKPHNQIILQKIYDKFETFKLQQNALTFKELKYFLYESFQDLKRIPQLFNFSQTKFFDQILSKARVKVPTITNRKITFDDVVHLINDFKKQIPCNQQNQHIEMQKADLRKCLDLQYETNYIPLYKKYPRQQNSIMLKKPVSMEIRKWKIEETQLIAKLLQRRQDELTQKSLQAKIEFLDIKPNNPTLSKSSN